MYKGEDTVLDYISKKKKATINEISRELGMNPDNVRRVAESLREKGTVRLRVVESTIDLPTKEMLLYIQTTFPEFSVYRKACKKAGLDSLSRIEKKIGIKWAIQKGLLEIRNGKLVPLKSEKDVLKMESGMKNCALQLAKRGRTEHPVVLDSFFRRKLVQRKVAKRTYLEYTGKGKFAGSSGFNMDIEGPDAPIGKNHAITLLKNKIRRIMSELGFQEMDGSIIESSFWNFDALFQPQDHPARELADTFYLEGEKELPKDRSLVRNVKESHERGWKYSWKESQAKKTVLRTHTTCLSARQLAKLEDKKPRKFFSVGRVFRNEAIDFKHLAEFHQVEGIIAYENATFRDLLGILQLLYRKLGFEKVRFRPSFFPYTEPSLEIEVFFKPRGEWLELGGAGIFRPEVTEPLSGTYPVLAWGLSLERPLMMMLELEDIRTFYRNDLDFLKKGKMNVIK